MYRNRSRRLTGLPVRPAAELLGKVPEGQLVQASLSPSPRECLPAFPAALEYLEPP